MPFIIKICGLREPYAIEAAIEAGANATGFMAWRKSKRHIEPERLAALLKDAPAGIIRAGVFVDPSLDEIKRYIDAGINVIQLHGSESREFACEAAKLAEVWKAFRPVTQADVKAFAAYPATRLLVDAACANAPGGTGLKADWELAREAAIRLPQGMILAGGLTPANVAEAIAMVKPTGVDVSSGVESAPGVKDAGLIKAFVRNALNTWKSQHPSTPEAGRA